MKIDLPITIIFDCQNFRSVYGTQVKDFIPRVCTLRFDSDDCNAPVELISFYPPDDAPGCPTRESGDGVIAMLSSQEFSKIVNRAKSNPYQYGVGTEEERTAAQSATDALSAEDGPND